MIIVGAGNRYSAEVDSTNRLLTRSVSLSDGVDSSYRGDGFYIYSTATLTTATESALFYLKNDEDQDIVITTIQAAVGDSTGATTDNARIKIDASSTAIGMTGGTGLPVLTANLVVGSPDNLNSTSEEGQEGAAITPAQAAYLGLPIKVGSFKEFSYFWIIPKGSTLFVTAVPPVGNTSVTIELDITLYLRKADSA